MSPEVLPPKKIPTSTMPRKRTMYKVLENIKFGQKENLKICSWMTYTSHLEVMPITIILYDGIMKLPTHFVKLYLHHLTVQ